ncbi:integrase [Gossypium australe]|uniref:Integrase n=1 Tax=Gossypium australe TaxID=47621 RepID=A0A5B6UTW6_9ROSI|nr:integrase [Gossypium australe]
MKLGEKVRQVVQGVQGDFTLNTEDILFFRGRLCVACDEELQYAILRNAHSSPYAMHPGIYQKVKAEHHYPSRLLQPLKIPEWKWERITMDFVSSFSLTSTKKDDIWVIMDHLMNRSHFLAFRTSYNLQKLPELYIAEIM